MNVLTGAEPKARKWLIQLALAVMLAAAALAFRFAWCSTDWARDIVEYGGYWMIAATVGWFLGVAWAEGRRSWRGWGVLRRHWPGLALAVVGAIFWQVNEPHDFKVLFDEHVLAGTAREMHFERVAAFPGSAHEVNGRLNILTHAVDKRPVLYPFLVATLHDLTGYRPENSFYTNGLLGLALLVLVYFVGAWAGGWKVGCFGQLLLIGLPLLAQNATGGGFDLLNVTMLCAFLLAGWNYWRKDGTDGLNLWVLTTVLLANSRYESLLYFAALPVLILAKWVRERQVTFTWTAACVPLLAVLPLLCQEVFTSSEGNYQTSASNFLNLSHVPDNVSHALYFLFMPTLFTPEYQMNNSVLLSVVGVVAMLLVLFEIAFRPRKALGGRGIELPLLLTVVSILGTTSIALTSFWGNWDDAIVARFSLPLQLAFAVCAMQVAAGFPTFWAGLARGLGGRPWFAKISGWRRQIPPGVLGLTAAYAFLYSPPISARAFASTEQESATAYRWVRDYMQKHADTSVLFISRSTLLYTIYGYPSTSIIRANVAPQKVMNTLANGMYQQVWVVQEYFLNRKLNAWLETPEARIDQRFKLQTLAEFPFRPNERIRISKIVGWDPSLPAGTVLLKDEVGSTLTATEETAMSHTMSPPSERVLTARPAGEPPAIPSETDLPTDPAQLIQEIESQLP